jgi:hypothetical protein
MPKYYFIYVPLDCATLLDFKISVGLTGFEYFILYNKHPLRKTAGYARYNISPLSHFCLIWTSLVHSINQLKDNSYFEKNTLSILVSIFKLHSINIIIYSSEQYQNRILVNYE